MAWFIDIKSIKAKIKLSEIGKDLGCSSSTSKRYRNYKNMISPYRNPSNINKRKQMISHIEHEPKRAQMSSIDPQVKPTKSENKLNAGANCESNDKY